MSLPLNYSADTSLPIRILLVDDDEDDYVLTGDYLTEAYGKDVDVTWASSFNQAREIIAQKSFDIYLIDYMLGKKNGIELTREITANNFVVNPVILLTGIDNREVDLEATQSGAMDYLIKKNLSSELLERSIRYALKRKSIEEKMIALAQHDPLTGLANRTKFNISLSEKIQRARREKQQFAIFLLDLDNFKEVNDTLGHSTGDTLLKITARRLLDVLRDVDIVARLGGDEFAIVADFQSLAESTAQIAERLNDELSFPFTIDYHNIQSSTSIGIAIYPNDGSTPDALLKSADLAMYKSKRGGRSTYRYYDPEFELELTQSKQLQHELQNAIERNEFELFYHPIINTETNKVEKAEALIRWQHPTKGLLSPYHFIEAAEKNRLILPIGQWVLKQAMQDCKKWQAINSLSEIGVTINLSPHQFRDEQLLDFINHALDESGLNKDAVTLEITETTLMEIGEDVLDKLERLEQLGIDIAIDDFGTGYSSLAYLKQFPVSTLKVDRSFVSDIDHDEDDKIISKAIINLGQSLNKSVIAEGIETQSQLDIINRYGCHLIQGYFYAEPMPYYDFLAWFEQYLKRS